MKNRLKVFFILVAIASGTIAGCGTPEDTGEGNDSGQTDVNKPVGGGGSGSGTAVCGNGLVEKGETCDDKNTTDRDGCSASCQTETNFNCVYSDQAKKSVCTKVPVCGDGYRDDNEVCDDGNTDDNDGPCLRDCSGAAVGWTCTENGCNIRPKVCGDGEVFGGEECDWKKPGQEDCNRKCNGWLTPQPTDKCGNGVVDKDVREVCDAGKENNTGGYEKCRKDCTWGPRCGDGAIQRAFGEVCDDGNREDGDGCDSTCQREGAPDDYYCPPGRSCIKNLCGDGKVDDGEECDDHNRQDGDGCSADCKRVEFGYECTKTIGQISVCTAKTCGDGVHVAPEQCDDGNLRSGDGCNSFCELEDGYYCETQGQQGQRCERVSCGDGNLQGTEQCDDGNQTNGDGCSSNCQIEVGYKCWQNAADISKCGETQCGDGVIQGAEQCEDDDGLNPQSGDGCSSTCQIEDGYHCPNGPGQPCVQAVCGNGIKEGNEICDDGNVFDGDGCDHNCVPESLFFECSKVDGKCKPVCGDGVTIRPEEQCDDGNLQNGDGCSDTCTVEYGFECSGHNDPNPKQLKLPITYRDFKPHHEYKGQEYGNDFERGTVDGTSWSCFYKEGKKYVKDRLGADGTPEIGDDALSCRGYPNHGGNSGKYRQSPDRARKSWYTWYHDTPASIRIDDYLTLTQDPNKTDKYVFDAGDAGFFPIDGKGWGNYVDKRPFGRDHGHNFHFTDVFKTYFRYSGDPDNVPVLEFIGDDDLWVFINGRLVVDLGGQHGKMTGQTKLTPEPISLPGGLTYYNAAANLYKGGIYEIAVFHAERQTTASNYKITLDGFINTGASVCESTCGDKKIAANEECDDGNTDNNDGCSSTCTVEPGKVCDNSSGISVCTDSKCGNGTREYPEQCDLGTAENAKGVHCTPDCQFPFCGDGIVDTGYEECDPKNDPSCGPDCHFPVCGDGRVEGLEECEDGNNINTDNCVMCKFATCGDGFVGPLEVCDNGTQNGEYSSCNLFCDGNASHCGDAIIDADNGEECDDGALNTDGDGYNLCRTNCMRGPHCGDAKYDKGYESCDDGNDIDGDGCSSLCIVEPDWQCTDKEGAKSVCTEKVQTG